ncbi:hypothetical protein ABN028_19675 [Actinopolymorpha sp. B17G11]|uniref:hypothetical protein n=1 Tax=Actinopolymorpha sp. B17G11 TaxID=3160861 RepID=UPI0032E3847D
MTTKTDASVGEFVLIRTGVDNRGEPVTVMGERVARGIVLVPHVDTDCRLNGQWDLIHEQSCRPFTQWPVEDVQDLRDLAASLASAGDWTVPFEDVPAQTRQAATSALTAFFVDRGRLASDGGLPFHPEGDRCTTCATDFELEEALAGRAHATIHWQSRCPISDPSTPEGSTRP